MVCRGEFLTQLRKHNLKSLALIVCGGKFLTQV